MASDPATRPDRSRCRPLTPLLVLVAFQAGAGPRCALSCCSVQAVFRTREVLTPESLAASAKAPLEMGIVLIMVFAACRVSSDVGRGLAGPSLPARVVSCRWWIVQALEILTLVLVNVALGVYLFEKGLGYWREHRRLHRLVNDHPEMNLTQTKKACSFLKAMFP